MAGSSAFFASKRAAAILKHAILNAYIDPFVMKTGSTSPNGRVAFIDGYAGEGRYADGSEGSPALLIRKAHGLASKRRVECLLVERDPSAFLSLSDVVAKEAPGLTVSTFAGEVTDHLDAMLALTVGIPLFVFLDPFGLMIPFDDVLKIFARPKGLGAPATEVLINFTAIGLRRIAGLLFASKPNEATLTRMDDVCGGPWWRDAWREHASGKQASDQEKQAAEDAVVVGYARRISKATNTGWWITDVRNRPDLRPAYHLLFFSRHPDGLTLFGESLSLGLAKWRRVIFDAETEGTLFTGDDAFKVKEAELSEGWVVEIESNLRAALANHGAFKINEHYSEVFGSSVGLARQKHLRDAWKRLHTAGATRTDSTGKDLLKKRIEPA